jgi:hypothetical protein
MPADSDASKTKAEADFKQIMGWQIMDSPYF